MNNYFVTFHSNKGFDCCDIKRNSTISSMEDIKDIISVIENTYHLKRVRIIAIMKFEQPLQLIGLVPDVKSEEIKKEDNSEK